MAREVWLEGQYGTTSDVGEFRHGQGSSSGGPSKFIAPVAGDSYMALGGLYSEVAINAKIGLMFFARGKAMKSSINVAGTFDRVITVSVALQFLAGVR